MEDSEKEERRDENIKEKKKDDVMVVGGCLSDQEKYQVKRNVFFVFRSCKNLSRHHTLGWRSSFSSRDTNRGLC